METTLKAACIMVLLATRLAPGFQGLGPRMSTPSRTAHMKRNPLRGRAHQAGMQYDWVSVGPNPCRGVATVRYELSQSGQMQLAVCNGAGARAMTLSEGYADAARYTKVVDVSHLAPGIYYVRLSTPRCVRSVTLVVLSGSGGAGAPFLNLLPTARSAALSGAMTANTHGLDALQSNPGTLAFQNESRLGGAYFSVLPGDYPDPGTAEHYYDRWLADAGFNLTLDGLLGEGHDLGVGVQYTELRAGGVDVVNDRGDFLGRYQPTEMSVSVQGGLKLSSRLGLGIAFKCIRSSIVPDWVWLTSPELGVSSGGEAVSWAIDAGGVYRPTKQLSIGLSVTNLGTQLAYDELDRAPLPTMVRFGFAYTPVETRYLRPTALIELDKLVTGEGIKPFKVGDVQRSAAAEVAFLRILTIRGSYLSDPANNREGIAYGGGIGYEDYFAFDVANDAAQSDPSPAGWRFTLTLDFLRILKGLGVVKGGVRGTLPPFLIRSASREFRGHDGSESPPSPSSSTGPGRKFSPADLTPAPASLSCPR